MFFSSSPVRRVPFASLSCFRASTPPLFLSHQSIFFPGPLDRLGHSRFRRWRTHFLILPTFPATERAIAAQRVATLLLFPTSTSNASVFLLLLFVDRSSDVVDGRGTNGPLRPPSLLPCPSFPPSFPSPSPPHGHSKPDSVASSTVSLNLSLERPSHAAAVSLPLSLPPSDCNPLASSSPLHQTLPSFLPSFRPSLRSIPLLVRAFFFPLSCPRRPPARGPRSSVVPLRSPSLPPSLPSSIFFVVSPLLAASRRRHYRVRLLGGNIALAV